VGKNAKKQAKEARQRLQTCFVCDQMEDAMQKMLATVCRTWETQKEFRQLFEDQPCLCLPHFVDLVEASAGMSKKAQGIAFSLPVSDVAGLVKETDEPEEK
jgi:hypothetical protein